jgi:hypothetical protein
MLNSTNSYIYKLYGTNSFNSYILYTNCIVPIRTTSRERAARAARAKPEHTSCPDQATPGCPDVRVHPAAPTLGYTRLPRPLGYTWLPQPVRLRSWGGWVRNGIKITISKMRLYKFIRATYSREFNTEKHTISLMGHIVDPISQ